MTTGAVTDPAPHAERDPRTMLPPPMPFPPQRWQCSVCVSLAYAWEAAHEAEIQAAIRKAAEQGLPPGMAARLLPPGVLKTMPPVTEAVTLVTLPDLGLTLVCAAHVPAPPDPGRRPLLVATPGMSMTGLGL